MNATNRNNRFIVTKFIQKLIFAVLFLGVLAACNKDDDSPDLFINATTSNLTVNDGINDCNTSLGDGTTLRIEIRYTASPELSIDRLKVKTRVSNGESEEATTNSFNDDESKIIAFNCFHFGSQDWVEFEVRLESNAGVTSNPTTVRINKPNGAE